MLGRHFHTWMLGRPCQGLLFCPPTTAQRTPTTQCCRRFFLTFPSERRPLMTGPPSCVLVVRNVSRHRGNYVTAFTSGMSPPRGLGGTLVQAPGSSWPENGWSFVPFYLLALAQELREGFAVISGCPLETLR